MARKWEYCHDLVRFNADNLCVYKPTFENRDSEGWELVSVVEQTGGILFWWKRPYVDPLAIQEAPEELI